jgi:type I restriction enzyme S subunit
MRLPPYPKYRPSGAEWLGDVPEHWDVDRLKWNTTGTINGIRGEEPNGVDDLICVRVADFDRERFIVVDDPPTLRAVDEAQRKGRLLRKHDLLIEKSGGGEKQLVGCVVFFDHEFTAVCSNFVARMPIAPPHSPRFWPYAHAALYAGRLNYPAIKQTTGIQNLDSAAYLDTRVGFPPEGEQRTIAEFLDRETAKIDALMAKKWTLIERLQE